YHRELIVGERVEEGAGLVGDVDLRGTVGDAGDVDAKLRARLSVGEVAPDDRARTVPVVRAVAGEKLHRVLRARNEAVVEERDRLVGVAGERSHGGERRRRLVAAAEGGGVRRRGR